MYYLTNNFLLNKRIKFDLRRNKMSLIYRHFFFYLSNVTPPAANQIEGFSIALESNYPLL